MKDDFLTLATRVILEETSEEETAAFHKALNQDAEKRAAFEELKEVWDLSEGYKRESYAVNDWGKLSLRLQPKPKQAFLSGAYQKMALAASVALIAAVSWVLWLQVFSWETIEATAANQEIILPDNSQVVLKKGSQLRYKKDFKKKRELKLKGEAWFEVTKDAGHPFRIQTKETVTTVLGTSFDIHEINDAGDAEIRVVEGKVSFEAQGAQLILSEGMAAHYNTKQGLLESMEFGSMNQVSWVNNKLSFDNTAIHTVLKDVAHYYEVSIEGNLPKSYCTLSGEYGTSSKEEMLDILRDVLELEITVQGNAWIIQNGTCRK